MGMDLFDPKNKASARKTDPIGSHTAADKLNEVDAVTAQEQEVLAALRKHGPCTAKELGARMAYRFALKWKGYTVFSAVVPSYELITLLLTEAGKPHRRLKALVDDEKVQVEVKKTGNVYSVE